MSTELSNGVIIPEEYSDDWYDEMSINLRKLNDVITAASDNATNIQRLDTDKANQSDLTALTSRVSQNETDIIALQTAVSGALKREIVQTLPTEDISTTTIYMIRNSESSGTNIYDEYMYINSQWELIGTSATDFGNYYTKNETDNLLSGKVDNSTLGSYYTKTESDNLLSAKANQTDLTSLSGRVTQNETDITALQTAVSGALKREIVQSLPTQDISTTTIYMIRNTTTSGDNIYDEYMYINNLWELIGTSATDFSNYYTKTEIDTLLSNKANDSDVVHKSGNETINGYKTFSNDLNVYNSDSTAYASYLNLKNQKVVRGSTTDIGTQGLQFQDKGNKTLTMLESRVVSNGNTAFNIICYNIDSNNQTVNDGVSIIKTPSTTYFAPTKDNAVTCGRALAKWSGVYSNEYYYGANSTPFTNKFVTTDTAQTITGQKLFDDINTISSSAEIGVSGGNNSFKVLDKNKKTISRLEGGIFSSGMAYSYLLVNNGSDVFNGVSLYQPSDNLTQLRPYSSTLKVQLGASNRYFTDCYTSKVNGLEPSSLSLPSGGASNFIDIRSYFSNTGSDDTNSYTALANGWIYLRLSDISNCQATVYDASSNRMWGQSVSGSIEQLTIPILKGQTLTTQWATGSSVNVATARFIPCLGNI